MKHLALALFSLTLVTGITLGPLAPARADIPPPEVEQCHGKKVGDTCGSAGVCQDSTCSRATPDGESSYACVKCVEGAAPPASKAKNCGAAPDAMLWSLLGGGLLSWRRRRA